MSQVRTLLMQGGGSYLIQYQILNFEASSNVNYKEVNEVNYQV